MKAGSSKQNVISSSASGKVILIGEHAVVYGHPALISTIDLEVSCEIRPNNNNYLKIHSDSDYKTGIVNSAVNLANIAIQSPLSTAKLTAKHAARYTARKLRKEARYTWRQLQEFYDLARVKFDKYTADSDRQHLDLLSSDWYAYSKIAIQETVLELNLPKKFGQKLGLDITLDSEVPVGGFGSSTAIIVAIVRAVAQYGERKLTPSNVYRIAHRVETMLRGTASGADEATIAYTGLIKFRKNLENPDAGPFIQQLELPTAADSMLQCLVIDSGRPKYTTGEVVAWLKDRRASANKEIEAAFSRLAELTFKIELALQSLDHLNFRDAIAEAGELLIKLGIVTPETLELINKLKRVASQAVFKVSGAGSIGFNFAGAVNTGGSGAVLCFAPPEQMLSLQSYLDKLAINYYPTALAQ